ncbi:HD domain-containing protein [Candidatus Woesearchaeota archaeon]|nr:HD domain-containing protein [Candidatus Woesearchaeota archaeon]
MNIKEAEEFAKEKFKILPKQDYDWNFIHSRCVLALLETLSIEENIEIGKLEPLVYIHDVGKVIHEENHAQLSLEILEKKYKLGAIEKDCIVNHGSSGKPLTPEGKIFRYADGLSLFHPIAAQFILNSEGKEQGKRVLKKLYEKYCIAYKDNDKILRILELMYKNCI